jgi:uncharacterized protein
MIAEEPVSFRFPGGPTLDGRLTVPPHASRGVVVCHPHPLYGGDMDNPVVRAIVDACLAAGLAVLRFDFRGTGRSAGVHDGGTGEQDDVRAALDLLEGRLQALPAVAGYSFGASMAAVVAASGRRLAGVALVAPPGDAITQLDSSPPLVLVAGSNDHVCSSHALRAWRAVLPAGSAVHVLPGADHFFSTGLAPLRTALAPWARLVASRQA